jgi:Ni,Fe-hydrogenase III large subunit
MQRIGIPDRIVVHRLIIKELEASATSNTSSMVRKQHRSICNIYKLIMRRYSGVHRWCRSSGVVRKCRKREHILIKHDIMRYVNAISGNM